MLYPFLKISAHYSASDRARKVRNKNLKSGLKNQKKEKDQTPQKKEKVQKKSL
ncbi:hypothetical protein HpHA106_09870 [Helicobacter pylori]